MFSTVVLNLVYVKPHLYHKLSTLMETLFLKHFPVPVQNEKFLT